MPAGRPTKLTDDIQETICKHVAAGVSYADAARLVGVGTTTLHRWKTTGQSARSGQFRVFWDHVQAALAEYRAAATEVITRAGHGHNVSQEYFPKPGRWALLGTGLQDLTLGPAPGKSRSVLLTTEGGCRAHFFITNGIAADR